MMAKRTLDREPELGEPSSSPSFGYSILYVPSVPAALSFYDRAFGLGTRLLVPTGDYAELETGPLSTALAFVSNEQVSFF